MLSDDGVKDARTDKHCMGSTVILRGMYTVDEKSTLFRGRCGGAAQGPFTLAQLRALAEAELPGGALVLHPRLGATTLAALLAHRSSGGPGGLLERATAAQGARDVHGLAARDLEERRAGAGGGRTRGRWAAPAGGAPVDGRGQGCAWVGGRQC